MNTIALLLAAALGQTVDYKPAYHEDELVVIQFDPGDAAKVAVFWNVVDERFAYSQVVFPDGKQTLYAAAPPAKYVLFANILTETEDGAWQPKTERIRITVTRRGAPDPDDPDPDPDDPDPEPDPNPSVPPDAFDNIGQSVAKWAGELGLSKRREVASNYDRAAAALLSGDFNISMTINESASYIREENGKIFATVPGLQDKYSILSGRIGPVWTTHIVSGGATKQKIALFYQAIAKGLKA